jgi:hypothetical protein
VNSDVCSALAGVFPLITITVVLEGRNVAARLARGHRTLDRLVSASVSVGAIGLVLAVVGIQSPLPLSWAAIEWTLFGVAVLVMAIFTMLTAATYASATTPATRPPNRRRRPRLYRSQSVRRSAMNREGR